MKRKLMAMLLIVCMIFGSSMTTFAATGDVSGNSTVSGNGNVSYKDTVIYSVTLPTDGAIDLIVDPQGLSQLVSGNSASKEELAAGAGTITSANPIYVANNSSVAMKISVKMNVTGDATPVTTAEAVNVGDVSANNILLYAVPSSVDTKGSTSENYAASTTGLVLGVSENTASFVLDEADYVFTKNGDDVTYTLKPDGEKHGFAIKFEGMVNKEADWSAYAGDAATKTIGYKAVFSFAPAETTDVAVSGNGVYGLMSGYGTTVTVAPKEAAPTFTAGDTAGTIKYTKGVGDLALDTIDSVMLKDNKGTYYDVSKDLTNGWYGADIDEDNCVITIDQLAINKFNLASSEVYVTYTNVAGDPKETVPFTVTLK